MDKIKSVEDLDVFKMAHELTLRVYRLTSAFPAGERFGLTLQLRRASSSIGANLMEGSHRLGRKEFRYFVGVAKGSAGEVKYHLLLARDLAYMGEERYRAFRSEAETVSKMLHGLAVSLSDTDTDTDTDTVS